MFFWSALQKHCSRLFRFFVCLRRFFPHNGRRDLLGMLYREYVEETESMLQFQYHAERMRYRRFHDELCRIAEDEKKHADWLRQRIIALGGEVPHISFAPKERRNSWECLGIDLEAERRCRADLIEGLVRAERTDPETAAVLSFILEEEENHRDRIMDMLMRSDPQAGWRG